MVRGILLLLLMFVIGACAGACAFSSFGGRSGDVLGAAEGAAFEPTDNNTTLFETAKDAPLSESQTPCARLVTATRFRMDPGNADASGWRLDLQFKCGGSHVNVGSSYKNPKAVFVRGITGRSCPELVDTTNWLTSTSSYDDQFIITVCKTRFSAGAERNTTERITASAGAPHMPLYLEFLGWLPVCVCIGVAAFLRPCFPAGYAGA